MTTATGTEWTMREIEDVNRARVAALLEDGLSIRDIAEETGLSKSSVQRLKKQIEAETVAKTGMKNDPE
jgi:transposase